MPHGAEGEAVHGAAGDVGGEAGPGRELGALVVGEVEARGRVGLGEELEGGGLAGAGEGEDAQRALRGRRGGPRRWRPARGWVAGGSPGAPRRRPRIGRPAGAARGRRHQIAGRQASEMPHTATRRRSTRDLLESLSSCATPGRACACLFWRPTMAVSQRRACRARSWVGRYVWSLAGRVRSTSPIGSVLASTRARLQIASWCLRLGRAVKLRASSSSRRCCGVAATVSGVSAHPFVEIADLDAERLGDGEQPAGGDPVDALLVLVGLLVGDPDQLGHLLLGQAQHDPPLAHPRPDMTVDVLRP